MALSKKAKKLIIWATFPAAAICGVICGVCQMLCPYIGIFCLFPFVATLISECAVINLETRLRIVVMEEHRERFLDKHRRISERVGTLCNPYGLLSSALKTVHVVSYLLNVLAILMPLLAIGVGGAVYLLASNPSLAGPKFMTPLVFDWCVEAAFALYVVSCVFALIFGVLDILKGRLL